MHETYPHGPFPGQDRQDLEVWSTGQRFTKFTTEATIGRFCCGHDEDVRKFHIVLGRLVFRFTAEGCHQERLHHDAAVTS